MKWAVMKYNQLSDQNVSGESRSRTPDIAIIRVELIVNLLNIQPILVKFEQRWIFIKFDNVKF